MEYADVCQPTNLAADAAADFPFRMNVFPSGLVEGEGDEVSVEEVSFATYCLDSYKGLFVFLVSVLSWVEKRERIYSFDALHIFRFSCLFSI